MVAGAIYGEAAADRVSAISYAWGVPLELDGIASINAHAEVFRCSMGERGDLCLKLLHSSRGHLAYLERVLDAMWGCVIGSSAAAEAAWRGEAAVALEAGVSSPMPRVLRAGMVVLSGDEDAFALLTPWVEGEALSDVIRREAIRCQSPEVPGPLLRDGLALVVQLACALRDLGRMLPGGAVHGDVKPSNVVVRCKDADGEQVEAATEANAAAAACEDPLAGEGAVGPVFHVTLIDYDTMCRVGDVQAPRHCGSPGYAAPERVGWLAAGADAACVAPQASFDAYSFGVTAHGVLTGHLPYACPPGKSASLRGCVRFYRSVDGTPALDASLPEDVRELLGACLAADPQRRPSAGEPAERALALARAHRRDDARCSLTNAEARALAPTVPPLLEPSDVSAPCPPRDGTPSPRSSARSGIAASVCRELSDIPTLLPPWDDEPSSRSDAGRGADALA